MKREKLDTWAFWSVPLSEKVADLMNGFGPWVFTFWAGGPGE